MSEPRNWPRRLFWVVAIVLPFGPVLLLSAVWWAMRAEEFRHATDLKHLGIGLKMYAHDDSRDCFPPLSSEPGRLMFDTEALHPEYLNDPRMLLSHADPLRREIWDAEVPPEFCFENSSYFYLGYEVWDDETVEALAEAYRTHVNQGLRFDSELPVDLPVERLVRLGNHRKWLTVAEGQKPKWEHLWRDDSESPLLIERPHPYPGPVGLWLLLPVPLSRPTMGGMVLYQDGHTEFIPYPGKWPMTERSISALMSLEELGSGDEISTPDQDTASVPQDSP